MDNNNIETLIIQERIRKNALNRASYLRRKANGTNNALIPIELQKTRGRKPKAIDENEIKNYTPARPRGRPAQSKTIN